MMRRWLRPILWAVSHRFELRMRQVGDDENEFIRSVLEKAKAEREAMLGRRTSIPAATSAPAVPDVWGEVLDDRPQTRPAVKRLR